MGGLLRLPVTFITTRFLRPAWAVSGPGTRANIGCAKEDLSERFWQATATHRAALGQLGFRERDFSKAKNLDPRCLDTGGIGYLHADRSQIGRVLYVRIKSPAPTIGIVERITLGFTAAFTNGSLSCTNGKEAFDLMPGQKVFRFSSDDATFIYTQFQVHLKRRPDG